MAGGGGDGGDGGGCGGTNIGLCWMGDWPWTSSVSLFAEKKENNEEKKKLSLQAVSSRSPTVLFEVLKHK